jgi:hypothetical protein
MLRCPFVDEEFDAGLMWFVGRFSVYDREETLGIELEVYDPNNKNDRVGLIKKYALDLGCLSYRHKFVLVESLANKLHDRNYDFQSLFEIDEDEASCWPREEWYKLESPRGFFQHVYTLALEVWEEDLLKASQEDRAAW